MKAESRRSFLKTSTVVGAALAASSVPRVHAGETHLLKVGLIGCGGRGRGAAQNALQTDPNARLVAVGDAFPEKAKGALEGLQQRFGKQVDVSNDRIFSGLDSYKKVIAESDVVLLCEPPQFRPISLRAAVEAGKQVFCEKPIAVDAPGIKHVLDTWKMAKEKGLNLVSGLCWRHEDNVRGIVERVCDGIIGDVLSAQVNYMTGRLWTRPKLEYDSEIMFQIRNWYNFVWLSGDFNVEQHVHSLDKGNWGLGDLTPLAAYGVGGRMARTEQPAYGDIFDYMSTVFEFPNGRRLYSCCRQQTGCWNNMDEYFIGTRGYAYLIRSGKNSQIFDYDGKLLYEQQRVKSNMYLNEHKVLFDAIRSGGQTVVNNIDNLARSTMIAILGRTACYTGRRVTWEEAMATGSLSPSGYTPDSNPPKLPDAQGRYKIPVPGLGEVYHTVTR